MKPRFLRLIAVHPLPAGRDGNPRGVLIAGARLIICALGRSGMTFDKREGDGATPRARLRVLGLMYRADRGPRPAVHAPRGGFVRSIAARDGWCDAPGDRRYNRPVPLPWPASHERLAREDALYDLVLDLSWNRGPIRKGRGSAIFMHVARPGLSPTEGCIALDKADLRRLCRQIGPATILRIGLPGRPRGDQALRYSHGLRRRP